MQAFVQFLIIGLGAGATYALFAQGAVLIYRGSGLVNFAQGAIGTFAAYIAFVEFVDEREWAALPAIVVAVVAGGAVSLAFQATVLRALRKAAPIIRVIATIGLLGLLQSIVLKRWGAANRPVDAYLPDDVFRVGDFVLQEARIYLVAITLLITFGLWAWTRYTRVGLAISASAQNERAVQTLGWSPGFLAGLTWTMGGVLGGLAAVLAAPLTGLSAVTFTIVVTVAGLGAALLGGFQSFPLTLLGGLIIGVGESMATLYGGDMTDLLGQDVITGLNRLPGVPRDLRGGGGPRPWSSAALARRGATAQAGYRSDQRPWRAARIGRGGGAALRRDGRLVGPGHLHLAGDRGHGALDRGSHRLRRADLAGAVGTGGDRRADRRSPRAGRPADRAGHRGGRGARPSPWGSSSRCPRCAHVA